MVCSDSSLLHFKKATVYPYHAAKDIQLAVYKFTNKMAAIVLNPLYQWLHKVQLGMQYGYLDM